MQNRRGTAGTTAATVLLLIPLVLGTNAAHARKAPPVALATAERGPIVLELSLTGTLRSPQRARLAPEVTGRVAAVTAEAGDALDTGAELLQIDPQLQRIELRQADAARRETEAELANARRRLREARQLALRENIAQTDLEGRQAEVHRLEAVLARREAERSYQAELLARHSLVAPFAGVVNRRMIDLGERADPDTPAFELVATDHLWLDLAVPQGYFGDVRDGTPVRVRFDALPDETLEDNVARIVPVSDSASRTFLARVDLDNSDGRLMPGMSARATLRIDTGREGVLIPRDGLLRYPDGRKVVWIAQGEGDERTVRERRVTTGLKFNGRIAILDGLSAGAEIVTEGNEALQDGQRVRVTGMQ